VLQQVAEHASLEFLAERSAVLDRQCEAVGRDPSSVLRSVQLIVSADDPAAVRQLVGRVIDAGFGHVVLAVRPPAPDNVARWLANEIIGPVRARS